MSLQTSDTGMGSDLLLSVVIPAYNEEETIEATLRGLYETLHQRGIAHELLVVNDNSEDGTEDLLMALAGEIPTLRYVNNSYIRGFGMAVRAGLENFDGDIVAIVMADGSDAPQDLVRCVRKMEETQSECVFGSRFMQGGRVESYPPIKKVLNRIANNVIRMLFGIRYDDTTNAFKLYRRHVIDGLRPFLSWHFNLTVELPLKAIVRGYSYEVIPISWRGRTRGQSKLLLKEMGSRYLFIVLYCFLEKWLSVGDYRKGNLPAVFPVHDSRPAPSASPSSDSGPAQKEATS